VSLNRILDGRPQLKYFEAGMDLRLSTDPYESFRIFQGRILELYLGMSREFNFQIVDANQSVEAQQAVVRQLITSRIDLDSFKRNGGALPRPMPNNLKTKWRREIIEEPSLEDREAHH
jgi:dTMP kinase